MLSTAQNYSPVKLHDSTNPDNILIITLFDVFLN